MRFYIFGYDFVGQKNSLFAITFLERKNPRLISETRAQGSRGTTLLPGKQALTGTASGIYPAIVTVGFRLAYLLMGSARGSGRIFSLSC